MLDLMVRITHECNLNCLFCHLKNEMKNKAKAPNLAHFVAQYLEQNAHIGFSHFAISGGEPFSDIALLEQIINVFLKFDENIDIDIMTNGTYLNQNLAQTFNEFDNIHFCISLSAFNKGEKSVANLLKTSPYGYECISAINSLKNKRIRFVLDNFIDEFVELEIYNLVKLFNCNIELALNYENLVNLDVKDAYFLIKTLDRLKILDIKNKVSFNGFFDRFCDCTHSKIITPKAQILTKAHESANDFLSYGCSHISNKIGLEFYKALVKIITNFKD